MPGPVWHYRDEKEARKRAEEIGGVVIESYGPGSFPDEEFGFWSEEPGSMLRPNERLVADYS